jgi:hypothetical protein
MKLRSILFLCLSLIITEQAFSQNPPVKTKRLHVVADNNGVAILAEDDAGNDILKAEETGGVRTTTITGTLTVDNNQISYAEMQDVSAGSKLMGRGDSGSGDPQEITLGTNLSMSGTTLNATGESTSIDLFMRYRDDFLAGLQTMPWGGVSVNSGTNAISTFGVDGTEQSSGVVASSTGTNTTGGAGIATASTDLITFGFGFTYKFTARVALSAASDGTDTYTVRIGFLDSQTANSTDGAYFRYTHGTNSGKWEAVTVSNGVETAEDTGIAGAGDTSFHHFEITATGTQIDFKIDGSLTNDITTNIINDASRLTSHGVHIRKSAGTTARILYTDYLDLIMTRSTAR